MIKKALWAVTFAVVAGAGASAQDPLRVEKSHYTLAFENDTVQVVNVHYGPHEKSAMHDHPGGVVVTLTSGHLKFTDQDGKVREVYSKAGESRWFPPMKHSVENLGTTSYNAVYIGMKSKVASAPDSKSSPDLQAMDSQTRAIIGRLVIGAH